MKASVRDVTSLTMQVEGVLDRCPSVVRQAVKELQSNPSVFPGFESYVSSQGRSPAWFRKLFKRYLGVEPRVYHRCYLVYTMVQIFVERPDAKVGDVGRQLGFSHTSSFSRSVVNTIGVTPSFVRSTVISNLPEVACVEQALFLLGNSAAASTGLAPAFDPQSNPCATRASYRQSCSTRCSRNHGARRRHFHKDQTDRDC